jgi:hypothetical protein
MAALFALGVGFASGMWAVIDAAVLRPHPYRDADALVVVMETHPQRGLMAVTPANFLDFATRVKRLENVAGGYAIDVSLSGVGRRSESPARRSLNDFSTSGVCHPRWGASCSQAISRPGGRSSFSVMHAGHGNSVATPASPMLRHSIYVGQLPSHRCLV